MFELLSQGKQGTVHGVQKVVEGLAQPTRAPAPARTSAIKAGWKARFIWRGIQQKFFFTMAICFPILILPIIKNPG
jgi:hypothetical protein